MVEPNGQRGRFFRGNKFILTQSQKQNARFSVFNVAPLHRMVSQPLVELPRTLKGQNGVEFGFQSISIHFISLRRKNGSLLGHFLQIFGLSKNIFFLL